jgi:hypothetical protein
MLIAEGICLGLIDPDEDDCDWWIGNRDLGTGIRGGTFDIELFVFGEHNCIKLLVSVREIVGSIKLDAWILKFVNREWGRWFRSTVYGTGDRFLLS